MVQSLSSEQDDRIDGKHTPLVHSCPVGHWELVVHVVRPLGRHVSEKQSSLLSQSES